MLTALTVSLFLASASAWTPQSNAKVYGRDATNVMTWIPGNDKFRGVNLGSQFIIEPWMAGDEFSNMGCGGLSDEWSCVEKLGQDAADTAFKKHWDTWITQDDVNQMKSLGLNTVRIPVGFWIREDLVKQGENYPRGGIEYLDRLAGWFKDAGIYVIIDLHGGPGVQFSNNAYTGHVTDDVEFYNQDNYERAAKFLEWMTERIHTNATYGSVGMIEVLNEPVHSGSDSDKASDMINTFYPLAWNRIRDKESSLGISDDKRLHIMFMDKGWGSGDPTSALPSTDSVAFDDHRYFKWDTSVTQTKDGLLNAACGDKRESDAIVGEWSIAVADDAQDSDELGIKNRPDQAEWYQKYFSAQVQAFEKANGWIFWSWKCNWIGGYNDWRWCMKTAVAAGAIPKSVANVQSPC